MKFSQPIFLLTLSIASALTLFADAVPSVSSSSLNKRSPPVPAQEGVRLAAASISKREQLQRRQLQQHQKRGGLSSHPAFKATRPPTTTTSTSNKNNKDGSSVKRRNDRVAVSAAKIDRRGRSISSKAKATAHYQQHQQELRQRKNHKNSDDENRASAAVEHNDNDNKKSTTKKKRALLPTSASPVLRKRAAAAGTPAKPAKKARSPPLRRLPSSSTPKKNTPLLLLPDSRSVWHTGSYQTVRWNRKYTKSLPPDTTVDIVLIDSNTNKKVASLKRFVPFKKGGSQVWVPTNIPEGTSFVLVLELYRGRSKEPIAGTSPSESTAPPSAAGAKVGSPYRYHQGQEQGDTLPESSNGDAPVPSQQPAATTTADVLSRIVRRSDINIASAASKRDVPRYPPGSSYSNANNINDNANDRSNPPSNNNKASTGSHHDVNHDDFYTGASQERSMDFLPDELRQEYPNTIQPLTLEHTFGLHQKVYTLTPYTLEWKIPERVAELLEYTRQAQALFNSISKSNAYSQASASALYPKSTFMAKVLVEIIKDETMEAVSVLARDVPAETMFQYLSIQDRLAPAFYRLRVQMVVVQVRTDFSALANNNVPTTTASVTKGSTAMEGWEFPEGGEVIDRYEAITRRFWVSQGAI
ncbi:hypothetical protein F5H01DRAFT_344843 [Linnemannia elongata]|nr:hypothetical protein F5H01DRAFT_344843 [Linnemannia elongata]